MKQDRKGASGELVYIKENSVAIENREIRDTYCLMTIHK